jgi:CDP-glucose 4,6-dehydratase
MTSALRNVFKDLPVLVTGHTGFKGSWLSIWLNELGAQVIGYSLDPPTTPSHFQVCRLAERIIDVRGDVRNFTSLRQTLEAHQPQVVFHLAAQAMVLRSFDEPKATFDTNVAGTINILESIRTTKSVKALVCITSDKCYENREWVWGYRENDLLGGHDPYSASKAMSELAIASYRRSFFSHSEHEAHRVAIASTRAGNVIGGGDYAEARLVPDCMRALMTQEPVLVRNPHSVRPWQYVLEPLSGYLWLAVKLLQHGNEFAEAWNLGPVEREGITAQAVTEKAIDLWGSGSWVRTPCPDQANIETGHLRLNWDKAANRLTWRPTYTWEEALAETVRWFKAYQRQKTTLQFPDMYSVSADHIRGYTKCAHALNIGWAR